MGQIIGICRGDAMVPVVEQRIGGDFLLQHGVAKRRIKAQAIAKIVTFGFG